jgi:hypothetical protein
VVKRVGDLEVNEDLRFQRRMWVAQRVGWIVMALVVLAALLGLLGPGLLSTSAKAGSEGTSLSVEEYERVLRYRKPTTLRLGLGEGAVTGTGEARLWLDRKYLESFQVQKVTPEPDSVEAGPDRLTYVFDVRELSEPTSVTFELQPEKMGLLRPQVGLDDGEQVSLDQFVYP